MKFRAILQEAGVPLASQSAGGIEAHTPIDGSTPQLGGDRRCRGDRS